jgi:hypothetical protein
MDRRSWAAMIAAAAVLVPAAASAQVAVFRGGSDAEDVPPLPIVRGSAVEAALALPAAEEEGLVILSGERLWLVDTDRGTVTACEVRSTTSVSSRRVRCTDTSLP